MRYAIPLLALSGALLGGCGSMPGPGEGGSQSWLLAPAAAIAVVEKGYTELPHIGMALGAWALVDPLAPNWEISAARLDERHVRFHLTHKLLHTGGEGEARQVLARNAERLSREEGFSEFEILRFEEGIESTRPFARRIVVADVRLLKGRALPGL